MALKDDLLRALPGGEWLNVRVVGDGIGAMAHRAVRANALWARKSLPLYLKCIPVSRAGVGQGTTAQLTDPVRLVALHSRLERARMSGGPLVDIPFLDWIDSRRWLVIGMEPVTPIVDLIDPAVPNVSLSLAVLQQLNSAKCRGWFHFDICTGNAGVSKGGNVVFIDPESYLEQSAQRANVSVAFAKGHRLARALRQKIIADMKGTEISTQLAMRKHDSEVALLAAECCLGTYNRSEFSEAWVRDWCADPAVNNVIASVWLPHLLRLVEDGEPEIDRIIEELRSLNCLPSVKSALNSTELPVDAGAELDVSSPKRWTEFEAVRRLLRERRLTRDQIAAYRKQLETSARREPSVREWWAELLMIHLVYAIDLEGAERVASEALVHHPKDAEFEHDRQYARRWRQ